MPAVVYDLNIEQGATYTFSMEWREDDGSDPPSGPMIDTTDYDAYMQIRQKPGGTVYASFDSVSDGAAITVNDGVITVRLGATETDLLTKQGVYDLELHNRADPTDVVRLIMGKVKVSRQVTDDA